MVYGCPGSSSLSLPPHNQIGDGFDPGVDTIFSNDVYRFLLKTSKLNASGEEMGRRVGIKSERRLVKTEIKVGGLQ